MKYNVIFTCDHTQEVELFGRIDDRMIIIKWLEETAVCRNCYDEQKNIEAKKEAEEKGLIETEVKYNDYKTKHPKALIIRGSYNSHKKTIKIYV